MNRRLVLVGLLVAALGAAVVWQLFHDDDPTIGDIGGTGGSQSEQPVNADHDVVADSGLSGGRIAGRVVDDVSGEPVAGLEIGLFRPGGVPTAHGSSADDGSFRLDGLSADTYRLRVSGRGRDGTRGYGTMVVALEPRDIPLAAGATVDDLVLRVCRGASLEGDVRLPDGSCVKDNVHVQLVRLEGGAIVPGKSSFLRSDGATGNDTLLIEINEPIWAGARTVGGRYSVNVLPAGEYRVLADRATPEEVRDLGQPVVVGEHETVQLDLVAR